MSASNSAERDETLDWLMDAPSETGHAFWGMDPSGFCTCRDCNPTRVTPPGGSDA